MTPIEAVHTFARRICIDRLDELHKEHLKEKAEGAKTDLMDYARRDVVQAILVEVERLTPPDFRSRGHAVLRLIEAGQTARYHRWPKEWRKPPHLATMQEERDRFCTTLRHFAAQGDWKHWRVEPLPYRRTLREEESEHLMTTLRDRWGITGKWWLPFQKYDLPYEAIVLNSRAVWEKLGKATLQQILAGVGVQRVYELWEARIDPDREMELSLWDPYRGFMDEKYWLTEEMDWLFYTTHENSTTIAGDRLLKALKSAWPDWESHRWIAPWKQQEQG